VPLTAKSQRWAELTLLVFLLAALGLAGYLLTGSRPSMFGLGLGMAAAAPLLYLVHQWLQPEKVLHHPVLVSVSSGLGCVIVMVGIQRFGEHHQWILVPSLAVLVIWMVYQRWVLRRSPD